ncbi:MAG: sigma-54 dependent transcriptional regulator [Proteobacteria bacterium]|nr:sigma-54 dependent transcriptional regulator [Pseudomonadota bacterium]
MVKHTILIVDDEETQRKAFGKVISSNLGHKCIEMKGGLEAVDFFLNKKSINNISCNDVDVMLLDLSMPDLDGLSVLKQIAPFKGDVQVIVLTAKKDLTLSVAAINYGAIDYIVKGDRDIFARISASINNAIEKKNLKYQVSNLARKERDQVMFSDIIGRSEALSRVVEMGKKVANSSIPVLIDGPSGSGKELLARAIHGSGSRSGKPFIAIDCDALRDSDAEEKLFGSDGVVPEGMAKNIGKLREANSGTIFFRRIDLLRPALQIKLLHFLQEGEFTPVAGKMPIRVDVRMMFSTIFDSKQLVANKKIREDLFYRISVFPITMPSLRDRGEGDIKILSESFCRDFSTNENKKIRSISQEALSLLYLCDLEENIRQLKNTIFRAVILCDGDSLSSEHFPQLLVKEGSDLTKTKAAAKKRSDINSEIIDIFDEEGKCKTMDAIEEEVIKRLVDMRSGNLSEVAKQLNIGRSTIYRKLKIIEQ